MREIMDALYGLAGEGQLDTILEKRLKEVGVDICRLEKIRGSLLTRSFLEVIYLDKSEPTVKDVPAQRVVSRREKGTYQDVIPRLMSELMGVVFSPENQRAQVKCTGMPITIYHDNEYKETDADIEVALPISGSITVGPECDVKTLEGGRVVSYIHKGPYQDVGVAHEVIHEYMAREGLVVTDVCREVYLNDPNETPEEELLTEVQVPVTA
jgi:effector-binding domain-containing protein